MQAVVIAAGTSSRFWPFNQGHHKTQLFLLGKPILYWTLKGLADRGIDKIVVVANKDSSVPAMLKEQNDLGATLHFAVQEQPLGTGHALLCAKEHIKEQFFLVWPSQLSAGDMARKVQAQAKEADLAIVGSETKRPWENGMVRFERGKPVEVVEKPEKGKEPSTVRVVGLYRFQPDFFEVLERTPRHDTCLVDAVSSYLKDQSKNCALVMEEQELTLKYPWHAFSYADWLFASPYFQEGIHPTAKIGRNVLVQGQVHIGENTIIRDNTVIEGPAFIGKNCVIGYSNVIRGPVNFEQGVKTGAFFEAKHSIVQHDTSFHSGYLGDSVVGANCRIGACFVSANRRFDRTSVKTLVKGQKIDTGLLWFGTAVGDKTYIGIHAATMPGVFIGTHCRIGPGTLVYKNVPDDASFATKFDQESSPA